MRRALNAVARAVLEAGLAGAIVGLFEATRLVLSGGPLASLALLCVGLAALAGVFAGTPVVILALLIARVPAIAAWRARMASRGPSRVGAVTGALVGLGAAALFAYGVFLLAVWTDRRFNAAGAVGLLHAAVCTGLAVALLLAALAAGPALARAVAHRAWAARITSGRVGAATLMVTLAAVLVGGFFFLRAAAPAADLRPGGTALGFLAALIAVARLEGWRRMPPVVRAATAGALVAIIAAALAVIGQAPSARQRIAARGVATGAALRGLWAASDRDGDGFASRFGGSDCDDANPAIHPGASEVAANQIDDNCAGGDVTAEMLAPRTRTAPSARPASGHNVLLITVDAVRADHTSAYGYRRATTPTLERLAARGARFEWALTPSPTTRRAIPALLTGRYASTLRFEESDKLWPPRLKKKAHHLLGQSFKAAGYDTRAILCCTTLFDKTAGVVEGIDDVDATAVKIKKHGATHIADRAVELLSKRTAADRPLFLWLHFLDPHNPYERPSGAPDFGDREIDRYDSEIWLVDREIGRILAALESSGQADRTVVAVTADHGDEFMEHGNRYHGRSLYSELERVPLVIATPGGSAQVVPAPVSIIDVGPTLLDLVGLARPAGQNGRSLAPTLTGGAPPDRMVLAELIADRNITRNLVAGFKSGWVVIWDQDANTHELYSLERDPANRRDLSGDEPERLDDLRAQLERQIDIELTPLPTEGGRPSRPPATHQVRSSE